MIGLCSVEGLVTHIQPSNDWGTKRNSWSISMLYFRPIETNITAGSGKANITSVFSVKDYSSDQKSEENTGGSVEKQSINETILPNTKCILESNHLKSRHLIFETSSLQKIMKQVVHSCYLLFDTLNQDFISFFEVVATRCEYKLH